MGMSMGRICQFLVNLGIMLLPFFSWSYFSPFEVPKTWLLAGITIFSFLEAILLRKKEGSTTNIILLGGITSLVGWLVVCALMTGDFWKSWWGNPYRADGIFTLLMMIILGLTLSVEKIKLALIAIGSVGLSVWMIFNRQVEAGLSLGNPNMLAGYLSLTLPILRVFGSWHWVGVVIILIATGMTGSWGGIMVGIGWVTYLLLAKYPKLMRIALISLFITIVGLYGREYYIKAKPGYIVAESRQRIFGKALIAITQKPIIGWGWAQFDRAFAQIDYPTHFLVDAYVDRTHSSILEYTIAGGIPALALYLAIMGMAIKALLTSGNFNDQILGYVLLLYFVVSQTNITSVTADWLMWWGVGRAVSLPSRGRLPRWS